MTTILSISLLAIFTLLGFIHFYWLFGGKWGIEQALPTKEIGKKVIEPPKIATAIVGIGLISFGLFYLIKTGLINFQVPNWIITYGSWIIPSIFIIRAIGDFKYVGFFKKIKNTEFAKADSKWFAPLCLTIGIFGILIQLMNK
ncbi:hypothetical protein Lupro_02855 [Lutibacter profundi]|uniref:DUF3995 domain-containing protein n=2 Tax=Lutibacter profundi TaxID=1622118 RepID=A0A109RN54_9FLAO|nr:hypothetical protein Lupro_02855 [Lutibacter profundi]